MDDSVYQEGEIFHISDFLKSVSQTGLVSDLSSDKIQKIYFGDFNLLSINFWANPKSPDYTQTARWVMIKESFHCPKHSDLQDLLKQFHLFGDCLLEHSPSGLKIIHPQQNSELYLKLDPKDYVYLRGLASTKPFT